MWVCDTYLNRPQSNIFDSVHARHVIALALSIGLEHKLFAAESSHTE